MSESICPVNRHRSQRPMGVPSGANANHNSGWVSSGIGVHHQIAQPDGFKVCKRTHARGIGVEVARFAFVDHRRFDLFPCAIEQGAALGVDPFGAGLDYDCAVIDSHVDPHLKIEAYKPMLGFDQFIEWKQTVSGKPFLFTAAAPKIAHLALREVFSA